jgi:hypothetical protein
VSETERRENEPRAAKGEGGREGAIPEADLSGRGAPSMTSRRSPLSTDGEGGREVTKSKQTEGGRSPDLSRWRKGVRGRGREIYTGEGGRRLAENE